jgi:hypothetical protein
MTEQFKLNQEKRIPIPNIHNYFIDGNGMICYQNMNGMWMYCKKVDNKPGYVYIYQSGDRGEINQKKIADAVLDGYREKREQREKAKENNKLQKLDGRYKAGAAAGRFDNSKVILPLKPMSELKSKPIKVKTQKEIRQDKSKAKNTKNFSLSPSCISCLSTLKNIGCCSRIT